MSITRGALPFLVAGIAACSSDAAIDDASRLRGTSSPKVYATVPFKTSRGIIQRKVTVDEHGRTWIGDMGFGPITDTRPRSYAISDLDRRWPDNTIRFKIAPALANDPTCAPDELTVGDGDPNPPNPPQCPTNTFRRAVADVMARIPQIKFIELFDGDPLPDGYLLVTEQESGQGGQSEIGFLGMPVLFPQLLQFTRGSPLGTMTHEIGHTLGALHEHQRWDRASHLEVCPENTDGDNDFDIGNADDYDVLGPYDYSSRMHYTQSQGGLAQNPTSGCGFAAIRPLQDTLPHVPGVQTILSGRHYSIGDINGFTMMYGQPLAQPRDQDLFGSSIAVADFDRDGFEDIVVGTPGNNSMDLPFAGAVLAYKGNPKHPAPWKIVDPRPLASYDENGLFGSALAAGDFDGDGWIDLAVGAPSSTGQGKVYLFHGGQFEGTKVFVNGAGAYDCSVSPECVGTSWAPLDPWMVLTTGNASADHAQNGDHFGAALAVIHADGDTKADLIVGAPGKATTGRAYVFRGKQIALSTSPPALTIAPSPAFAGSEFGAALAVGILAGSSGPDVAVGAPGGTSVPGAGVVGGRVYIINLAFTARTDTLSTSVSQMIAAPSSAQLDSRFGAALATGPFVDKAFGSVLAIGAPRQNTSSAINAGTVHLHARETGGATLLSQRQVVASPSTTEEERFGAALAHVPDGPTSMLAIGAPRATSGRGRVQLMTWGGSTMQPGSVIHAGSDLLGDDRELGKAFAVGSVAAMEPDGTQRTATFFIGAPVTPVVDYVAAGRVTAYRFDTSPKRIYHFGQETKSRWAR